MNRLSLIKNASIYTFSNIINSALPFLLLPILTRYMSPSDFGIVAMFSVMVNIVSPFTGFSVHAAIQRQYYEKETVDIPTYVANCLLILLCGGIIVSIFLYCFLDSISVLSSIPNNWIWAVVVVSMFQFIILINLSLWQVTLKARTFAWYQFSRTVVNILLTLLFVVGMRLSWQGRIAAQIYTMALFGLVSFFILHKGNWIQYRVNRTYIINALKFGIPLVPHTIGAVMMTMTDRFFITNMVSIHATGLYSVGYQIGMIICIIENSFNQAYVPWLFDCLKMENKSTNLMIVRMTYIYFFIIVGLAIGLSILAPFFLKFFVGKDFAGATIFIFWIALGYAFSGMYKMVVNYIFFVQKTYILAWVTFSCALVNVLLNYILIKLNGSIGAAQATTITFFLSFIFTWILSNKVYKMPWLNFYDFNRGKNICNI